jgi:hypothetical protein
MVLALLVASVFFLILGSSGVLEKTALCLPNGVTVTDKGNGGQPACLEEWKKCKEEHE